VVNGIVPLQWKNQGCDWGRVDFICPSFFQDADFSQGSRWQGRSHNPGSRTLQSVEKPFHVLGGCFLPAAALYVVTETDRLTEDRAWWLTEAGAKKYPRRVNARNLHERWKRPVVPRSEPQGA
jgi:hypothetical protein